MKTSIFTFLGTVLAASSASAQTTGSNSPSALTACVAQLSETQNQLNECHQVRRAPDGDLCMVTLGATMLDGRCQCLPITGRDGQRHAQAPVPTRLANGSMAIACGTPHHDRPAVIIDRGIVSTRVHEIMDPIIRELQRRITVVEARTTTIGEQVAVQTARVDALMNASDALCGHLNAQAPSSGAPANVAATPATIVQRCRDLRADLEAESAALTALTARVNSQGTSIHEAEAALRELGGRIAALEAVWHGIEGRYARRIITVGVFLGGAGAFPIGGGQPTGFGRFGLTLRVPIASSPSISFVAQGEGGAGSGGLGATLAFGGRLGFGYHPENSVVGFSLGISGRNFWAPWQPPAGVNGTNRGWSAGGYLALQFHLGDRVVFEPWAEIGIMRSMSTTAQGGHTDDLGPGFTAGADLVINLNR